jgi:hypothetical protein
LRAVDRRHRPLVSLHCAELVVPGEPPSARPGTHNPRPRHHGTGRGYGFRHSLAKARSTGTTVRHSRPWLNDSHCQTAWLRRSGRSHDLGRCRLRVISSPLGRGDGAPRRRTVLAIAPSARRAIGGQRDALRGVSRPLAIGNASPLGAPIAALSSPGLLARVVVHAGDTVAAPGGVMSPGAGNRSTLRQPAHPPEDALGEPR